MADPAASPQQATMHQSSSTTVTVGLEETTDEQDQQVPVLKLRLKKPKNDKKVQWTNETVDNEHMNKKKSKCCCIYEKPKVFGESSSDEDSDDECEHCKGHVEKKKNHEHPSTSQDPGNSEN